MRFLLLLPFALGCGTDDDTEVPSGDTDPAGANAPDEPDPLDIPDPGSGLQGCADTEPNDTPEQAAPCGAVHHDPGVGSGAVYPPAWGSIGDGDAVDWFVFRTGDDTELLHQFAWWHEPVNLVDLAIHAVKNDGTLREIWRSEEDAIDGENLGFEEIEVKPDSVYLLEVIHVEGVADYGL